MCDSSFHYKFLFRLLLLLVFYCLIRLGFYLLNLSIFEYVRFPDLFWSFIYGVRFDLAALLIINSPLLIFNFYPKINPKIDRIFFVFLNFIGFSVSINDFELYSVIGKRLSFDFFSIGSDINDQIFQVALNYWYLPLLTVVLTYSLYFLDRRLLGIKFREISFARYFTFHFFMCVLSFVGIRGGLQHKSINVQSAFIQGQHELGVLVLNTPYYFFRTLNNVKTSKLSYFKSDGDLKLIRVQQDKFPVFARKRFNVVFFILESFSLEYMENGYMPFLSELSKKSLYFSRHLSNGRRSIESLPALLCGLPALIDEPISKSIFSGNKFNCFPKVLKEFGYTNFFFHAGARGTMGFEAYTLAHGFDQYLSKEDYPNQSDFDGTWGIFDGPYLQYVADKINAMPSPFLATVFTLSSHQPYSIPSHLKNTFPKGNLEIHESIGYVDYSLREFFKTTESEDWFQNTLFIITADHAQKLETKKFKNSIGNYRVPLLLYSPSFNFGNVNTNKVTQHSDIPATILNIIGSDSFINGMGRSIFQDGDGQAFNYVEGNFYYRIQGNEFYKMTKDGEQLKAAFNWETGEFSSFEKSEDPMLKAYLQYFINGLISNNLSLYR